MLLPSALSCEPSMMTRQQARFFASPPASPPNLSSQSVFVDNLVNSCRSLQSLITPPLPSSMMTATPSVDQLPPYRLAAALTPPMTHAPPPPKLRMRTNSADDRVLPRKKIVKRAPAPARGLNKRRRSMEDDAGRDDLESADKLLAASDIEPEVDTDVEPDVDSNIITITSDQTLSDHDTQPKPSTPKRARIAPEQLPLGLERSDFHKVHQDDPELQRQQREVKGTDMEREKDGEEWSAEDDRILVELVLDKLKLSKEEWHDCARSLNRDRQSVSRRWKSLMANGDVGVKRRRARLHSTWR